jgi:hypothetical protein
MFVRANGATVLATPALIFHIQNQGTIDALTTAGWNTTRTLNTSVTNTISGASLGSSQITLPAGTYEFTIDGGNVCVASSTTLHFQHRLFNVTDSTVAFYSTNGLQGGDLDGIIKCANTSMVGYLTIAGAKVFRLDTYADTGAGTVGGVAMPVWRG